MKRNLSYQIRGSKILVVIITKITSKDYNLVTKWDGRCMHQSSSKLESKMYFFLLLELTCQYYCSIFHSISIFLIWNYTTRLQILIEKYIILYLTYIILYINKIAIHLFCYIYVRNWSRQMQRFDPCTVTIFLASGKTRDPRMDGKFKFIKTIKFIFKNFEQFFSLSYRLYFIIFDSLVQKPIHWANPQDHRPTKWCILMSRLPRNKGILDY